LIPVNSTIDPRVRKRLSEKCEDILFFLKLRPRSNRELNEFCFSYRQRLSELRKAGYIIECTRPDDDAGDAGLRVMPLRGRRDEPQLELPEVARAAS
jgi:hypothetical protein